MNRFALNISVVWLALFFTIGCGASQQAVEEQEQPEIHVTLLQLNDVYEITPVQGGRQGGLARVATVRNRLRAENPNTFTLIAGDFFSPSALGTAEVDGERLAGRQMVAALNQLGLDYATFGNHEFDVKAQQFLKLLGESRFKWVSSNVTNAAGEPFPGVAPYYVLRVAGAGGAMRLGLVGATIPSNPVAYARYEDPLRALQAQVQRLRDSVDVLVALTHLTIEQDRTVAEEVPGVDLILGGHEHENVQVWRGPDLTPIFKADANARTIYVHELFYNPRTRALRVASRLLPITDAIPEDPATAAVVNEWVERAYAAFQQAGFNPREEVARTTEPLDGLEASVRNHPTALTALIAAGMRQEAGDVDLAIFNGGSVRVDDVLPPGPLTVYDVIRILPFGGRVLTVAVPGSLLTRLLDQGVANRGKGGYLQVDGAARAEDSGTWLVSGLPVEPDRTYRVAVNDFLVSGLEGGLGFFSLDNPEVALLAEHRDVRLVLIKAIRQAFPGP